MDTLYALTILLVFVSYSSATFQDEMAALEKEMMNDDNENTSTKNMKKSIKDLSTEELIAELEREFHDSQSSDTSTTLQKKYRRRFEDIISKKEKLDQLANADINTLLPDEKDGDVFDELIKNLDEEAQHQKKEVADDGECRDVRSDCKSLTQYCDSHKLKLQDICAMSCLYCVNCKQTTPKATCSMLKRMGKCNAQKKSERKRMIRLCPVTCAYCRVPSPPKCSDSKFGCCWDKSTAKKDKKGSNCPECKNMYRYVCDTFKDDCENFRSSGSFMRQYCPKKCDMCSGTCKDVKEKEQLCTLWKDQMNMCTTHKSIMKLYCPKTCAMC